MSEENPQTGISDRSKRKRKKSFLKNARKYAKKGCYGRGSQLDSDTYNYFVRIMEAYREGFDTDEDKSIFVNNVFEQTVGQEINLCCNQVGCRVVEMLVPFANEAVLERFMQTFGGDLRPLCSDRFASHVLEALVRQAASHSLNSVNKDEFKQNCKEFVLKVSRFLLNNLEDYLWDTYGSHVVRTCLESLAQIPKENKQKNCAKIEEKVIKVELPEEYLEIIKDCCERIMHWPQFNELCQSEISSGFLQVLLRALRRAHKKLLKKLLGKLIETNFAPEGDQDGKNKLSSGFLSTPSVMVLETALEVAKAKSFSQIFLKCFSGNLAKLATTRSTNFTVQKLILNCKEKSEFEMIFEELDNSFGEIIGAGHTGIVWALAQGCKTFTTKQGSFVQNLMKSLDCFDPEERQNDFVLCLSKFTTFEKYKMESQENLQKDKLNLHGTLILQLLLEFNKPIKIVNGILNMEQNLLKALFSNTMGSHVVDSFVKSVFVGEKSRERLVRKMKGVYQELASTKYGSRSFEAIWNAANLKNKLSIMEELAYKDAAWSNSEHGKIIAGKVNLLLYKRNKEEWKNSGGSVNKAKELFADILK
jgi:nucleolar protein 9